MISFPYVCSSGHAIKRTSTELCISSQTSRRQQRVSYRGLIVLLPVPPFGMSGLLLEVGCISFASTSTRVLHRTKRIRGDDQRISVRVEYERGRSEPAGLATGVALEVVGPRRRSAVVTARPPRPPCIIRIMPPPAPLPIESSTSAP